jgi:hypothetical protein
MAVTNYSGLTINQPQTGIQFTKVTDSSADWASISNSTYFYDKTDKLVHYKDSTGAVLEIFTAIPVPSTSYGLYAQTVTGPIVTGIAEQSIVGTGVGTLSVPANAFSIGDSFTAALDGIISCISSATIHIHVKTVAGVILADTGIVSLSAATNKAWLLIYTLQLEH